MDRGLKYLHSLTEWKGSPDFDLRKVTTVLSLLDNPQDKLRAVHVAGTNGKGSVSAGIAAVLAATGARVGLNTSPHLAALNERIIIDGVPVDNDFLSRYSALVEEAAATAAVRLSFHEGITALAFVGFHGVGLDWIVMEVGLGGRLDASNVLRHPEICAITTIDLDHEHILGHTKEKIAFEKAGIAKQGVPLVVGRVERGPLAVVCQVAESKGSPIIQFGRDFSVADPSRSESPNALEDGKGAEFILLRGEKSPLLLRPSLKGTHQRDNMAIVAMMASYLQIPDSAIQAGIANVFWPGRLELLEYCNHEFLIDCAHNPAGIAVLTSYLASRDFFGLRIGFGCLETKNWQQMIRQLAPYVAEWNVMTPSAPSAVRSADVADWLSGIGIKARDFDKDYRGFVEHCIMAPVQPLTLLAGSIYLIGLIRDILVEHRITPLWRRAMPRRSANSGD